MLMQLGAIPVSEQTRAPIHKEDKELFTKIGALPEPGPEVRA